MTRPAIMPQPGRLPHLVLQVLRACTRPLTRAELRAQLVAREVEATPLAIERATCKFARHGLVKAQRPGRSDRAAEFSLTHRGRQMLTDLDIELWWRTEGQVAV